jgi:hypothetical protein
VRFLFVGGVEHGKIHDITPGTMGEWHVHSNTKSLLAMNDDEKYTFETSVYIKTKAWLFDEVLSVMMLNGKQDGTKLLDAIIKPEIRELLTKRST